MKKVIYAAAVIAAGGLSLLQLQTGASGRARPSAAPTQGENVIVMASQPGGPAEVTGLHVGGQELSFGNSFAGDEDWVNALACEVRNTSGKTMTELRLSVSFEAAGGGSRRIHLPLTYAGSIRPGQVVRVSAAAGLGPLQESLARRGLGANFRRGELRFQLAKFDDGSVWVKGVTLGPPDARTGRRSRL